MAQVGTSGLIHRCGGLSPPDQVRGRLQSSLSRGDDEKVDEPEGQGRCKRPAPPLLPLPWWERVGERGPSVAGAFAGMTANRSRGRFQIAEPGRLGRVPVHVVGRVVPFPEGAFFRLVSERGNGLAFSVQSYRGCANRRYRANSRVDDSTTAQECTQRTTLMARVTIRSVSGGLKRTLVVRARLFDGRYIAERSLGGVRLDACPGRMSQYGTPKRSIPSVVSNLDILTPRESVSELPYFN